MNFYELIATEYKGGFLDQPLADKHLTYIAVVMWSVQRS
jgi:hypothetical protein